MIFRYSLLLTLIFFFASCQQNSPTTETKEAEVDSAIAMRDTSQVAERSVAPAEEMAQVEKRIESRQVLSAEFPKDQGVDFYQLDMSPLCDHKYGCIEEGIYPLGWSVDGKFAFFVEEGNEAVQNTTVHFIVQDMETDKELLRETFKASDQAGYTEENDEYTVLSIWKANEANYRSQLSDHQIELGAGTAFYTAKQLLDEKSIELTTRDQLKNNMLFDVMMVDVHNLIADKKGGKEKRIAKQRMGKYDMILRTKALGYFQSPFEDRIAVLEGQEKRGYEGPPNVLRLQVVGCDLAKGFDE